MSISALLIANRGEISIRIVRAAGDLGIRTVAVHSSDDADNLDTRIADEAYALAGAGAPAYLDIDGVIAAAKATGCDAIHPGYGFLAERAGFARSCAESGLTFIWPRVVDLALFGDKAKARAAAIAADVPVIQGLDHAVSLAEAQAFLEQLERPGRLFHCRLADGGIRWDEHRGRGEARSSQGTRGD